MAPEASIAARSSGMALVKAVLGNCGSSMPSAICSRCRLVAPAQDGYKRHWNAIAKISARAMVE